MTVLLIGGLLVVLQIGLYLHVHNVAAAGAAEGARLAADADAGPEEGAARAESILVAALGEDTGGRFRCVGDTRSGDTQPGDTPSADAPLARVRCTATLPVLFLPGADALPVDVTAHALDE